YLNATKDRTYCGGKDSFERRAAQTVWAQILSMLLHDLQPILVYTTDEAMEFVPRALRDDQDRAALLDWYEAPMDRATYEPLLDAYTALTEARAAFTKAYEDAQAAGVVTEKTTQAVRAELTLSAAAYALLTGEGAPDLAEAFVCSEVTVNESDELSCVVLPANGEKCPRCWNWRTPVDEKCLCGRCHEVVLTCGTGNAE
ncbi:MAG: isoleucine--tRNA ligase, partial [Atopobiaceae bacterium]|nr:isoleucine--tRNA ligase [Atopobiaceae bacterium]